MKHYNTLNSYNSIIQFKNVYEVITVPISMYSVSVLIKAFRILNSSPRQSQLLLVDLVGLAWKHRMKHAKLGSKEAHRLSRGRNRQEHTQTIKLGWPQCMMGAVICITFIYLGQGPGLKHTGTTDKQRYSETPYPI